MQNFPGQPNNATQQQPLPYKPGKYRARVADYGIGQTKAGKPQIVVRFMFRDEEKTLHEINWYGTLNPGKGQEITIKSLLTCGLTTNDLSVLARGKDSNALMLDKDVEIDIHLEQMQDGKNMLKVAWVNEPGGRGLSKLMDTGEAVQVMQGLNLTGAVMAARQSMSNGTTAPAQNPHHTRQAPPQQAGGYPPQGQEQPPAYANQWPAQQNNQQQPPFNPLNEMDIPF